MLCGSTNHRVLLDDGVTWKRLDALSIGDRVKVSGGQGLWPNAEQRIDWTPPTRVGLDDVAQEAGVSVWTVLRHRAGRTVRQAAAVAQALERYNAVENIALPQAIDKRVGIKIPAVIDDRLGAFLGYLVGDGHISKKKRTLGLTTGDEPQALAFASLASELFGVMARVKSEGNKLRVLVSSETLSDLLTEHLGLTSGPSARDKRVPDKVLRSPANVVRAFLRSYFDCDGHAGKQGVILSTMSDALAEQVQLLLMNFGVLSRRRRQRLAPINVLRARRRSLCAAAPGR